MLDLRITRLSTSGRYNILIGGDLVAPDALAFTNVYLADFLRAGWPPIRAMTEFRVELSVPISTGDIALVTKNSRIDVIVVPNTTAGSTAKVAPTKVLANVIQGPTMST